MSLTSIRNGLVTTIQAYGKWSATEISASDFGIMNTSASCVVLQPGPGTTVTPMSYGTGTIRSKQKNWSIAGFVFVKDTGNAKTLLGNLWTACDDIYESVNSDDTLNSSCDAAIISAISRPSTDTFVTDGNVDWGFIEFTVEATEYDE